MLNVRLAQREKEVSTARKETLETVAHDLKNPLSAIMMAAELLHRQSDVPTSAKQRIGMISSSVESMNRLIGNLLDHTKIESGSLALMKETCDLGTILTLLISRFELLAEAKGLKIVDETSAGRPALFVDPARVEQVFSNLLGNAVKFTPPGGTIRISDAIEIGTAELDDSILKERIAGLKAIRDQAKVDADRAEAALDKAGKQAISADMVETFATTARQRMRMEGGGYRRDHLRALAQRVEVADKEVRIMGSRSELLRTLVAVSSGKPVATGVQSTVPKWCARRDSNPRPQD